MKEGWQNCSTIFPFSCVSKKSLMVWCLTRYLLVFQRCVGWDRQISRATSPTLHQWPTGNTMSGQRTVHCHYIVSNEMKSTPPVGYTTSGLDYEVVTKSFRTESIKKYTLTTITARWEATWKVMTAKLIILTHKIAIQLRLVAERCIICSSCSRWPVRKLLDTPSYLLFFKSGKKT
jgi:hypothetical protein